MTQLETGLIEVDVRLPHTDFHSDTLHKALAMIKRTPPLTYSNR